MEKINWVHCCLIVHASITEQCRAIAASLTPAGDGMWTTPLSSTGAWPATHFISSGLVDQALADILDSPEDLASGANITIAEAQRILSNSDISQENPHEAMSRMGLEIIGEAG